MSNKCEWKNGIDRITAERQRQIDKEGWTPEHDDDHEDNELAKAAACYALSNDDCWPWDGEDWKPTPNNRIRELEKAGALIAAEIDRLLRAEPDDLGISVEEAVNRLNGLGKALREDVVSKCEWKENENSGKIKFCSGIKEKLQSDRMQNILAEVINKVGSYNCPCCGADIQKPEPEKPLIVKSGGTFAICDHTINYLVIEPNSQYFDSSGNNNISRLLYDDVIKPFSEIEKEGLTDEIALLRPMVYVAENGNMVSIRKLTYIDDDIVQCVGVTYAREILSWIRLATPHELQDQS